MKICILTPRFPFPENGGDVLRINNIARYLKEQNHKLILVSFTQGNPNLKQAYQLYDEIHCVKQNMFHAIIRAFLFMLVGRPLQCGYYYSWRIKKTINLIEQDIKPDIYISHLLRMTPYLDNRNLRSRTIVEMTDALSKTYALSVRSSRITLKRFIYSLEYKLIKNYEQYIVHHFPKSILVSQSDVDYLSSDKTNPHIVCMTNGVRCADQPSHIYNPNKICFVGNMRTLQNQDAVIYFVEEILPIIIKGNPKVIFYIVGAEPPLNIKRLACNPHVVVTSYVENVGDVISDACLSVAPIRIAAGIQNKVLFSLGQGIPIVISPLIANAIPELQDGSNCFIQANKKEFAQRCIQLMQDTKLREQLSNAGYQLVSNKYKWDTLLNGYEIFD